MFNFKVAAGPMSKEIVEAVFQHSQEQGEPVALIASKNQIDYDSGYVERWSTYRFMEFVRALQIVYPNARVPICRDHCGPGFNGIFDLEDTHETIRVDLEAGFDLLHIDFCHYRGSHEEKMRETLLAIELAQQYSDSVRFEIGTDEITDSNRDLIRIEDDIRQILQVCKPEYYVINTGSHTMENRQVGTFDAEWVSDARDLLRRYGLKLKEHNADFLTKEQIQLRRNLVDAVNIAPELGVAQTQFTLNKCELLGTPFGDWCKLVYDGGKWKKWILPGTTENDRYLRMVAAGHYHFSEKKYRDIQAHLFKMGHVDKQAYINSIKAVLSRYTIHMENTVDDGTL